MASGCYIGIPRGLGGGDFPSLFSAGIIDVLTGAPAAIVEHEVTLKMVEQKDRECGPDYFVESTCQPSNVYYQEL